MKVTDAAVAQARDLAGEHTEVNFNFTLVEAAESGEEERGKRARVKE